MRVLIIDESSLRAGALARSLTANGCNVVGTVAVPLADVTAQVDDANPDVVIVAFDSPTRDALEHLVLLSRDRPRPVIVFGADADGDTIRRVVRAGVSAYVVGSPEPERLRSIIDVAVARFDEFQRLKRELADANQKLSDRALIERAKGVLMTARGLSESEAYELLRTTAMNRKQRLAAVARTVLEAMELLG